MEHDDFQSLNKGVFVLPYSGSQDEAGPSQRPLSKVYRQACRKLDEAYREDDEHLATEQVDEVADWLDRCAEPPLLRQRFSTRRLPVALMQRVSSDVAEQLLSLPATIGVVSGRDMPDITSATRAVAIAFIGDAATKGKRTGRTPIEEVEMWVNERGSRADLPLLIFLQHTEAIPTSVLSELIYILNLHRKVAFRLFISVHAIRTFIANWTLLEPSEVALSVLNSKQARSRNFAVESIIDTARHPKLTPFPVTNDIAKHLLNQEKLIGGGPLGTLKSLKWLLLRHSITTPLAGLEDASPECSAQVQMLAQAAYGCRPGHGHEFFTIEDTAGLAESQNPSPRIKILGAMAKPATYLPRAEANGSSLRHASPSADREDAQQNGPPESGRPHFGSRTDAKLSSLQELEAVFALWQSSGKRISLWDWLEGFRHAVVRDEESPEANGQEDHARDQERHEEQEGTKRKRDEDQDGAVPLDEEEEARLHASFIRFVEESRTIGLVRAKGKGRGKRTDEVTKSVLML